MLQPLQARRRTMILAATARIAEFIVPTTESEITRVDITIPVDGTTNGTGPATFDVNLDGVSIFADPGDRPSIAAGASSVSISVEGVFADLGQTITVDADVVPAGGIGGPLTVQVMIEDGTGHTIISYDRLIDDLYQSALLRPPTGPERTAHTTALQTAESSYVAFKAAVRTMLSGVMNGADYLARGTSNAVFIEDMYRAFLGRPSDAIGYGNWVSFLATPHTRAETIAAFLLADELSIERSSRAWWQRYANSDAASLRGVLLPTGLPAIGDTIIYNADGSWHFGAGGGGTDATKISTRDVKDLSLVAFFVDNFNDNSLDPLKWAAQSGTITEQNGRLEFSGGDSAVYAVGTFTFGDGDYISRAYNRNGTASRFLMRLYSPSGVNFVDAAMAPDLGQVRIYKFQSGSFVAGTDYTYASGGGVEADVKFVRLRYTSGTNLFHLETSPDGSPGSWVDRGTISPPTATTDLTIQLITTLSSGTVWIDDFDSNLPATDFLMTGDTFGWDAGTGRFVDTPLGQMAEVTAAPTGVPSVLTGFTRSYYNKTDNKIYVWDADSATWLKTAALT